MQRTSRLKRELQLLSMEPSPGITCWQTEGKMDELRAQIVGGAETPFEGGVFSLEIVVPDRYPFEPPKMRFLTPIYHPNIDNNGRICHDALKLPPMSSELKYSKQVYLEKAKRWTEKHAVQNNKGGVVETVDSVEARVQPSALKREARDKTEEHPKRTCQ
ncbi:ubiquitin-conjugating enzyme E2 T isoform X2 [Salmo salar]|uniref:Ubiquitin-conjugating enzyme E2 T isoform X2 n=1 Tax=Salmo salar TaxID=8030 RepID=A0ABM3CX76_SALSA|nr:ubiquitin-conjugating enzyme E2 T isoform X2 [Salmo salar]